MATNWWWGRLAEDETWVISLKRGGAGYFVVPITDPWMITIEPAKHQTCLNQAHCDAVSHFAMTDSVVAASIKSGSVS